MRVHVADDPAAPCGVDPEDLKRVVLASGEQLIEAGIVHWSHGGGGSTLEERE
jgi:hypothetical protein